MSSDRNQHRIERRGIFDMRNKPSKNTFPDSDDDRRGIRSWHPRVVEPITTRPKNSQSRNFDSKLLYAVRSHAKEDVFQTELLNMAFLDDLTALYNRRGFLMLAEQQLKLARRNGHGVFLFFLDMDGLKQINDSLGHRTGDFALMEAAEILQVTFRDSDILARFGGDEFAVLALEARDRSEEIILKRLEENQRKQCGKQHGYRLSLSVGSARFDPQHPCSIGALMLRADEAMYAQKRKRATSCYGMIGDKRD